MAELADKIDAVLSRQIAPGGPGAAVGVLRGGALIHAKGYGLANIEWGAAITPDTVFHIASLTKQFTAVAVMMLKERGAVSLEAPLETYLTDFPTQGRRVTVRHLLNHTSGVRGDRSSPNVYRDRAWLRSTLADLVAVIAGQPFDFEPGERYLYNNPGYVLLGAIIERVSGLKYRDFLAQEIFGPLGMSRTRYLFDEPIVPGRAGGYQPGRDGVENASYVSATYYHAAGGLGSTVLDLARWDRAVRTNRLVSAEGFAEMLAPTVLNDGSAYPYGFGWGTATYLGRRLNHHSGGLIGFASHMLQCRDDDLTIIVLANLSTFPCDLIARKLVRTVLGEDVAAPTAVRGDLRELQACAGDFAAEGIAPRRLAATAGGLAFIEPGGPQLTPLGDGRFCEMDDPEVEYLFSGLENGVYTRFRYSNPLFPPAEYVRCEPDGAA